MGILCRKRVSSWFLVILIEFSITPAARFQNFIKIHELYPPYRKPGKFQGVQWEPVEPTTAKNGSYNIRRMNLDDQAEMINEPFLERLNFWKSLGLAYRNINSTVEESNEE